MGSIIFITLCSAWNRWLCSRTGRRVIAPWASPAWLMEPENSCLVLVLLRVRKQGCLWDSFSSALWN